MPIYEYRCPGGHIFEVFCHVNEKKEVEACPSCGAKAKSAILTPRGTAALWFEGKMFPHVTENRSFKSYRDLEKYLAKRGDYIVSRSAQDVKKLQDERKEKVRKGFRPTFSSKPKKFELPEDVKNVMAQTSDLSKIEKVMKCHTACQKK